jgi:bifunctional DNase/RNase
MPLGYVEVAPDRVVALGDRGALLLVDAASNLALPIFIGGTEAISIDGRLRGEKPSRPLTHDLLDHVLESLHASLVKAQVDELRQTEDGGVFIGSIFVRANGRIIKLDARPSDAIALAIGHHTPIYVARSVLDQAGVAWDELQKQLQAAAAGAST